ncbi:MAG: hypothetical protein II352_07030 [Selenomonadaceae bacterium]|nr:hypothetical protein [Selenomonadaceae bacterium]
MGMLDNMLCLNVRHQLPQIGIRQQQAMGEKNAYVPAELHHNYEPPVADVYVTPVKVDIDTYPSRTAYGFLNNTDFAKKYGDLGKQNIQSHTSELTQSAWDMAKNGARPGASKIAAQAKSKFWGEVVQWLGWEAKHVPDPVFTVTPSRVEGQMNPGSDSYDINTTGHADIAIKTGSAETYIAQKGDIRMWTTKGHYDIYA